MSLKLLFQDTGRCTTCTCWTSGRKRIDVVEIVKPVYGRVERPIVVNIFHLKVHLPIFLTHYALLTCSVTVQLLEREAAVLEFQTYDIINFCFVHILLSKL